MLSGIVANYSVIYQEQDIIIPEASDVAFHFAADFGVFNDSIGGTLADSNDTVAGWQNQGNEAENAVQSDVALRPRFRTGGLNGKPYIEGIRAVPTYFENLQAIKQGLGTLTWQEWTSFALVVDNISDTHFCGLLGDGSKTTFYFRPFEGAAIHWEKEDFRFGTISGPTVIVMTKEFDTRITAYFNGARLSISDSRNPPSSASASAPFLRTTALPEPADRHFSGHLYEFVAWRNFQRLTESQMVDLSTQLLSKYNIS